MLLLVSRIFYNQGTYLQSRLDQGTSFGEDILHSVTLDTFPQLSQISHLKASSPYNMIITTINFFDQSFDCQ